MADDPRPGRAPDPPALREVRAAQLRAKALRWGIGKAAFGTIFLLGALAHALGPEPEAGSTRFWMAALVILSTLNVGLALRTFSRVRRRAARLWPFATALWGLLATALIRFLIAR